MKKTMILVMLMAVAVVGGFASFSSTKKADLMPPTGSVVIYNPTPTTPAS